jgi:hypothetical protein
MWDYAETGETIQRMSKNLIVPKKDLDFGAESSILICVDRNTISSPIEQGRTYGVGEPWAILKYDKPLNYRQQALLDRLPEFNSRAEVNKDNVTMVDLSALTAKTGVEFAMFTRGSRRLIVRGDFEHVDIDPQKAVEMRAQGYKWSGHTHTKGLLPSKGDKEVLRGFGVERSVIYDAMGKHNLFTQF